MQKQPPRHALEYETNAGSRRSHFAFVLLALVGLGTILLIASAAFPPRILTHNHNISARCASNLHQLGTAAIMYANQHNMRMPDDLKTLFDDGDAETDVLICPASNLPSLSGATTQAADAAITSNQVSYIYLGRGLTLNAPGDTVLIYEPLGNHRNGINVLFVDSRIEWLNVPEATKLISRIHSTHGPVRYPEPAATQP